ncbi:S1C family serine protease [Candidatus Halobonum tyrrellensis]|uniref:Serine protease HtrA n=1 Tax=Candidatus Halobonum tyrrellensis G22 TaxID=1324957 RepID=V4IZW3_9EURY|nr:trypsin-like peptidase domain-containing protein [Candidatus Halobonum tyrrellensis]ESP88697.1 serine protease HtrA [Candidatus Halobonum tyrrellensis G22]
MPTRRAVLAAASATVAGLGGCLSLGSSGAPGRAPDAGDLDDAGDPADANGASSANDASGTAGGTASADAPGLTSAAAAVYERVVPSVVGVLVYDETGLAGSGSGFVHDGGVVVTNDHVVAGATEVKLRFHGNEWADAAVVGTDPYSDLAVLDPAARPGDPDPLAFVDADPEPAVGTDVLAIGSPYGYAGSASEGIVSGVDRLLPAPNDFLIADAVQTDAALNPGNSGGPLVTRDGRVAGVVSSAGGENLGFAISAALARRVVPALAADGAYAHPYVGVRLLEVSPTVAEAYGAADVGGVVVTDVVAGGPAAGVLRGATGSETVNGVEVPTGGDVIVAIAGTEVETQADLSNVLALDTAPGETVSLTVRRGGRRRTVSLELGERPAPDA